MMSITSFVPTSAQSPSKNNSSHLLAQNFYAQYIPMAFWQRANYVATPTLVDSGLVVRYYLDEDVSGEGPTTIVDSAPTPFNLTTINYDSSAMYYTSSSAGRGIYSTTTAHDGYARDVDIGGGKIYTMMEASTTLTLEVVADVVDCTNGFSRMMWIGNGTGNGVIAIGCTDNDIRLSYNNSFIDQAYAIEGSGRAVYHIVIDTDEGVAADRLKFYRNGVFVGNGDSTLSSGQVLTAMSTANDFYILNYLAGSPRNRAFEGTLSYGAFYNTALTPSQITNNINILLVNDDRPCTSTGDTCPGGAIYVGEFDGGKYMTTPGDCTDSATPTCDGTTDTLNKTWRGTSGSDVDISGVETVVANATPSSSSYRGNVNTPAIVADASVSSDSAADFCEDMVYAGYSDWFLPSKSELAFVYCKSNVSSHNVSHPHEDPNCVGFGGKTSVLQGFANDYYWASTEYSNDDAWSESFGNGDQADNDPKSGSRKVRCVRRYDNTDLPAIDWPNFTGISETRTIAGIGAQIDLELSATNGTGSPTLAYKKNSDAWVTFSDGSPVTVQVVEGDNLTFSISGTAFDSASITVTNTTYNNTIIDTMVATVDVDPCEGSPPTLGTTCAGGAIYAGEFDSGHYMITPGDCTDSSTPVCDGTADTLNKIWRGSTGSDVDTGVENIASAATVSSSSARGHVNTPIIVADASVSSDSAADYCNDMIYGGYDDWYLPSKSEMAFIYCKSNVTAHNTSYPNEDDDCDTLYGGKTSDLPGFTNTYYWVSTEFGATQAHLISFESGLQTGDNKTESYRVRCVRRYNSTSTSSGLVHHYKLDESNGLTAEDSVGALDGTLINGPVWQPAGGALDGAMESDGNDDYVSVPNTGDVFQSVPLSWSMWFYAHRLSSDYGNTQIFLRMAHGSSPWNSYFVFIDDTTDKILFFLRDVSNSSTVQTESNSAIVVGQWYHVVVTLDGSYQTQMYVNGVLQTDTDNIGSLYNGNDDLRFGGNNGSTAQYDGLMDDVRFYNRILSASEVSDLYNEGLNANAKNFFVLSANTFGGDLGGLSGANDLCLNELQNYDWRGKSNVSLNSQTVQAFLCDGSVCQDLEPNATYVFARAGSNTSGGTTFTTDANGAGPGNAENWTGSSYFNDSTQAWTGRANGVATLWPQSSGADHCTGWTTNAGGIDGDNGDPNNTDDQRWSNTAMACNNSFKLICMVHDDGTTTASADPYEADVVLLIQPDADDGSIVDYSTRGHIITANADAALSTAVSDPWGGVSQVIAFDGVLDSLTTPDSDDWYLDTDYTIETWVHHQNLNGSTMDMYLSHWEDGSNLWNFKMDNSNNDGNVFDFNSTFWLTESGDETSINNQWAHIALTKEGTTYRMFRNGQLVSSSTNAAVMNNNNASLYIGNEPADNWGYEGYMTGVRITKGLARYTANFTPPTEPFPVPDPCAGDPALGTVCNEGALYAGKFDGGKYMITPGNCTNSANPVCDGSTDTLQLVWRGSGGSDVDIAGLTNLSDDELSPTTERGAAATTLLVNEASIDSDSSADFCNNMVYGGYDDWFLPSKSEMAFIYCHASSAGSHNTSWPDEEPDCISYGGKTSDLPGFATSYYATSSESLPAAYYRQQFNNGAQADGSKSGSSYVRCARRYDESSVDDTPAAIAWSDFNDLSSSETVSGVDSPIILEFSASDTSGTPTYQFRKNGGSWVTFTTSAVGRIGVNNTDTIQFAVTGSLTEAGQITIDNATTGVQLDQVTGTVASTDPCALDPALATTCTGGALYAGFFDGGYYMITPGDCTDSANPTCDGTEDTLTKDWNNGTTNYSDIPGVSTVAVNTAPSLSSERGHVATPLISKVIDPADGGPHDAADYCQNMNYGGYSDWYLPSKSELAYIYCHASVPSHNPSYPQEDPNCVNYGGKTSELTGFASASYWATSEFGTNLAWIETFDIGVQNASLKDFSFRVRCIRRFYPIGLDVTPDPFVWYDFTGASTTEIIMGIDTPITLRFNAANGTGAPTFQYRKNGGAWTTWTTLTDEDVGFVDGDTLQFQVLGTAFDTGTITVTNLTDDNSIIAILTGTVPVDPCDGSPAIGTSCSGGAIYAGEFDGGHYMTTPGDCTDSTTPVCDGTTDTLQKYWHGSSGSMVDIAGVETVASDATASSSAYRGNVNSAAMVADVSVSSDSAADYCLDMIYGGYDDWYLPSKSELAFLYCKASVGGHNVLYPHEDPNCVSYGGKTSDLADFDSGSYWSSSEASPSGGFDENFFTGFQSPSNKNELRYVRCVRRYNSTPTAGLIHHYKLDALSGTTVPDSVGTLDGTASGPPSVIPLAVIDEGYDFNGSSQQVNIPNTGNVFQTAPFTWSTWVKFEQLGTQQIIIEQDHNGGPWISYTIQIHSSDTIRFIAQNSTPTQFILNADNTAVANKWYHVVATMDGSYDMKLYIDGQLQIQTQSPGSLWSGDGDLILASNSNGGGSRLNGQMDDVRFYNVALDAGEVSDLYYQGLQAQASQPYAPAPADCPAGYVGVPADGVYTTESFCVMKYEAKAETNAGGSFDADGLSVTLADYKPASVASNLPWRSIVRDDAISECQSLGTGYNLISNAQWQTMARNIELQDANWTGGVVGSGCMFQGNDGDTTCGYDGSDPVASSGTGTRGEYTFSNGAKIYDMAGNLWEWMRDNNSTNYGSDTYFSTMTDASYTTTGTLSDGVTRAARQQFGPAGTYSTANNHSGLGHAYINYTNGSVIRGGDWSSGLSSAGAFGISLGVDTTATETWLGFRCVYEGGGDPYASNVVLLIQPDDDDASIVDYSASMHTVNPQNQAALSTAISDPWGGNNQVIAFDGTDDYLELADSDDWYYSSDFTIEMWAYSENLGGSTTYLFYEQWQDSPNFINWSLQNDTDAGIQVGFNSNYSNDGSDRTDFGDHWVHLAFVKNGNDYKVYLGGNEIISTTNAVTLTNITADLRIGANNVDKSFEGYLTGIRVTKGVARYTDDFTPPAQAFSSTVTGPELIQQVATNYTNSGTSKTTPTFDVLAGDLLVAYAVSENDWTSWNTPTGGGLTWTLEESIDFHLGQWTDVLVWSAVVDADKNMDVNFVRQNVTAWGATVLTFRGATGVGAINKANVSGATPSISLTTTQTSSAVVTVIGDWNAVDGSSRAWLGDTAEQTYFHLGGNYTAYAGVDEDAGAAGANSYGLSAPGAQKYSIVALEVLGNNSPTVDPCIGYPAIGTNCSNGPIYAGVFDGGKYMITPGDCTDSATPTCDGTTDTLNKVWRGSTGSNVDIAGLVNIAGDSTPSSSNHRGYYNTPIIVADASISSDSAADYCNDMIYGGYTDWYLPSKSEMAYIYCHADISGGSHNTSYPQEDVNCASQGGKGTELPGFANNAYSTSSEASSSQAYLQSFASGNQFSMNKSNTTRKIRCVRRYAEVGSDTTPDYMNWADFTATSDTLTFSGIDTNILLDISAANGTGAPTFQYSKNGGSWTTFTTISSASVSFQDGDTLAFQVSGTAFDTGTITVTNTDDDNTVIDTVLGTVPVDPCDGSPSLGSTCTGGAIYAGVFDGGKYMITPGDCTNSSTPTCDGTTDTLQKRWRGTGGSSADLSIENITDRTIPSSSAYRGHVTTPVIVAAPSIDSDSAADYCNDMVYGGYDDWYLPSKSEMAYIYCHASVASHDTDYPHEDPDCTNYGGKTSDLTDFANGIYWTSTEDSSSDARTQHFTTGWQGGTTKADNYYIRCARRYGAVPTTGLIHHYALDETSGTTAADSVGSLDGTLYSGPTWTPAGGISDGALDFDGTNDYFEIPNTGDVFQTVPFTVSVWAKTDVLPSATGNSQYLFRMRHSASPWESWRMEFHSGDDKIRFVTYNSGGTGFNTLSDSTIVPGALYHIVATVDANFDTQLFINGVKQADTEDMADMYSADSALRVGANNPTQSNFDGLMDEIRFYNTVLSDGEVSDLYNEGANEPAKNFFVMTSQTFDGDLGGLIGADQKCLNDLQTHDWKGKAGVALNSTTVKAFLCEGDGAGVCNDPPANTTFTFARSGSTTAGGSTFTTDSTGRGPGDSANWSGSTYFDSTDVFWTNRRNDSGTLWNDEGDWNHCNGWTNNTGGYSGEHGTPNNTNQTRWIDGSISCFNTRSLVCMVTDDGTTAMNEDPYADSVVLLVQPDADTSTIDDLSPSDHTVTASGNAALTSSVTDPWGGSYQSVDLDGTSDWLSIADSNDWHFGSGDFTVEAWVYWDVLSSTGLYPVFIQGTGPYWVHGVANNTNEGAQFYDSVLAVNANEGSDNSTATGAWSHWAAVRDGNTFEIFVDGVSLGTDTDSGTMGNISSSLLIGGSGLSDDINGKMTGMRITKGVARYTDTFTPPTEPFDSVSLRRSVNFEDSGSEYMNRTPSTDGDRRTWTFATWFKRNDSGSGSENFLSTRNGGVGIAMGFGGPGNDHLEVWDTTEGGLVLQSTTSVSDTNWHHLVITYDTTESAANDRVRMYLDGTEITAFNTNNRSWYSQDEQKSVNDNAYVHYLGTLEGSTEFLDASLSETYLIDGSALDPSSFTYDDNGTLRAKQYSGSYGTNGFYLFSKFGPASDIEDDQSGNGHNFTPSSMDNSNYSGEGPP